MAEDAVDHAVTLAQLDERPCVTKHFHLHGYINDAERFGPLAVYGADAPGVEAVGKTEPDLAGPLHDALPITRAQVVWAARNEMARTVEDVLARRTRALLLDARAALDMAPEVARLLAAELGKDEAWRALQVAEFGQLAEGYLPRGRAS
jgi:glycerol-3-phosphate dehydrogenase